MLYPPRPANISIPAVIAGNVLQNDDTSISAIDSGYDGTIVMRTQNNIAMIINPEQKTSINTDSTNAMLTVNNNLSTTAIAIAFTLTVESMRMEVSRLIPTATIVNWILD